MQRSYSAVVFDFGGVLITPITTKIHELAERHDVPMEDLLHVLMGPREYSTDDHPWHRCERGEMTLENMHVHVRPFAEAAGIDLHGDEMDILLDGVFDVHHEVIDRIGTLKAGGYRVGLLTNSFVEFRPVLEGAVDFSIFDEVIDSSEVGCRKPEPEIYELTTARMGCAAEEIVYLDDFLANVEGARLAGWTAIQVGDVAAALAALDATLAGSAAGAADVAR